jgi:RimJ/RimL family protein N-acetyltransferase
VSADGIAPTLTDGVVVLDGYTLHDVDEHLAGEDEEQARRFGWYPRRSTRETVVAAIEHWTRAWREGGATRAFACRDARSRRLVGGCEVRLKEDGVAEMSYWTFPTDRGRGFASRAARLACSYAFAELGIERMEVYVAVDNLASRGVARRAGFTEEGVLRGRFRVGNGRQDAVLYARLATDAG